MSAKPSRTIKEPSSNARDALCTVISAEMADAFIAHRKAIKAPLTDQAAKLIVKAISGHHSPDEVVGQSIMNGWRGVFPDRVNASQSFKPDFSKYGVTQ